MTLEELEHETARRVQVQLIAFESLVPSLRQFIQATANINKFKHGGQNTRLVVVCSCG